MILLTEYKIRKLFDLLQPIMYIHSTNINQI